MIRLESKTRCGVEPSGSFHLTSDAKGAERQTGDSDRCESVALNPASTRCRLSALRAQFGLLGRLNVGFWHKADIRGTATFCPLLDKSGQTWILVGDGLSASLIGRSGSSTFKPSTTTFQTIHHCSVDVAHGLVLLFGIGARALPLWDSRTRRNNLMGGLTVRLMAGPSGQTNSPHPSSREGHLSTA